MLLTYCLKELRCLFRDRNILLYGVLLPVFLYPLLLFAIAQMRLYTQGLQEHARPQVAVVGSDQLLSFLRERSGKCLEIRAMAGDGLALLETGQADLVIHAEDEDRIHRLVCDTSRGPSLNALQRVKPLLEDYGQHVEIVQAGELGLPTAAFATGRVREIDVADAARSTRNLLALILPLVLIVMCTFGATYPAVDLTAGERERRSVETTILLPLPRSHIALGKSLAVTVAALTALVVNLCAMLFSAAPMLAGLKGTAATLPDVAWRSLPYIVLYGALLSLLFANLFLLVGSYAKNYREAQAYVTPLQVVIMTPALLTMLPGSELDAITALIPIYNAGLAFRAAVLGDLPFVPMMISLTSLGLCSLLCFRATVRRLSATAFVLGFKDPDQLAGASA